MRLAACLAALFLSTAAHAQQCREIRFAPGAFSGEVRGRVGADEFRCFTFEAAAGQTVSLSLSGSDNVAFTVPRALENRRAGQFRTGGGAHEVTVYQNIRAPGRERFRLLLAIQ